MRSKLLQAASYFRRSAEAGIPTADALQTKHGFTLVELMIVIALIGVLSLILNSALKPDEIFKKSRDTVRLSDLQNLRKSIELALSDEKSFDTTRCTSTLPCDSLTGTRAVSGSGYVTIDISKYLNILPADPLFSKSSFVDGKGNVVNSSYQFASDGNDFEIRGHLESRYNTNSDDGEDRYATDGGCLSDWYEVGTNLCLLN